MELGDGLVQDLGQHVDADVELLGGAELNVLLSESSILGLEQEDLSKDLVGERARHDKGRVSSGAAQVDETALGEEDDVAAVLHEESVDLGLDVLNAGSVGLQPGNVNLNIEVTNVLGTLAATTELIPAYLLQTIASLGIASKCSPTKISLHPVVVTKI
jgi:hypothetical protein